MVYIILHPRSLTWTLKSNHRKVIFQPSLFRVCAMRTLGFKWITFSCRIPLTNHCLDRANQPDQPQQHDWRWFFEQTEIRFIQFKIRQTIGSQSIFNGNLLKRFDLLSFVYIQTSTIRHQPFKLIYITYIYIPSTCSIFIGSIYGMSINLHEWLILYSGKCR